MTDLNPFERGRRAAGRYALSDVRRGVGDPLRVVSEVNKFYNHHRAGQRYNPAGVDVFAEDWDTLVILDACRYDEFVQRSSLPGHTESRISRGSTSPEFVRGNFGGKTLYDVVYVSANGWYPKLEAEINAAVHAFEFVDRDVLGGVTSHPATVSAAARDAAERFPDKRLIVHYMQPHHPFLGPTGDRFDLEDDYYRQGRYGKAIRGTDTTHADVLRAYRENLDLVLGEVEPLLRDLGGKTVVTADHGELLGDRERPIPVKSYRHPEGVYVESLLKVPWHVHDNGERRRVVAEPPVAGTDTFDFDAVERNLEDLGYRT